MLQLIYHQWAALVQDEEGAAMVEYVLLVTLIAVAAYASFRALGVTIDARLTKIQSQFE